MRVPFKTSADIIGHVTDIAGDVYWCNRAIPTDYGFCIWFGWRESARVGTSMAVFTQEVHDHMKAHDFSAKRSGLPVGEGVLRRFRRQAGILDPRTKAYREWKARTTPPPKIIRDIDGIAIKVTNTFSCDLGLPIYRGTAVETFWAGPQYILTPALAVVIREWSTAPRKLAALLPFDPKTLNTMRRRLGLSWYGESICWWADRFDDLLTLSPSAFAARHGKNPRTATNERSAVLQVKRLLEQKLLDTDRLELLTADWSHKSDNIKQRLGRDYSHLRRQRRAYKILMAADRLPKVA